MRSSQIAGDDSRLVVKCLTVCSLGRLEHSPAPSGPNSEANPNTRQILEIRSNPAKGEFGACHLLQLGYDDRVFRADSESDTLRRQLAYGAILERLRPKSLITIVVVTQLKGAAVFTRENVTFVPFVEDCRGWRKISAWGKLYRLLARIDRQNQINVLTTQTVHDEAWVALLFGKIRKRPVIGQVHYDIFSPHAKAALGHGFIGKLRYALLLRGLKWFAGLRVVGQRIASEVSQRHAGALVRVIPVPMPMLDRVPPSRMAERSSTVLFVGRLIDVKNLGTWLDIAELVAQRCSRARFSIVGDGPQRTRLQERVHARHMNDRVFFRGPVSYDDLSSYYDSAAVFLLTSLYEGFGRVVAEALSHALPVVAFRVTGVEDIVQHEESGFLHALGDTQAMAESVLRLLNDRETVERMGKAGQNFVHKRFNPAVLSSQWIQMLIACAEGILPDRDATE